MIRLLHAQIVWTEVIVHFTTNAGLSHFPFFLVAGFLSLRYYTWQHWLKLKISLTQASAQAPSQAISRWLTKPAPSFRRPCNFVVTFMQPKALTPHTECSSRVSCIGGGTLGSLPTLQEFHVIITFTQGIMAVGINIHVLL